MNDRVFDFKHNSAYFHALDLTFTNTPDNGWGGLVDVTIGKDADAIAAYGTISKSKGPANGANHYVDPTQFFVYYGAAPFSIIAGKYVTRGRRSDQSDGDQLLAIDTTATRPFTHTEVRATYKVNDALTVLGGVNEGWDAFGPSHDATVELGGHLHRQKPYRLRPPTTAAKSLSRTIRRAPQGNPQPVRHHPEHLTP